MMFLHHVVLERISHGSIVFGKVEHFLFIDPFENDAFEVAPSQDGLLAYVSGREMFESLSRSAVMVFTASSVSVDVSISA